jgi:hypothetical protein
MLRSHVARRWGRTVGRAAVLAAAALAGCGGTPARTPVSVRQPVAAGLSVVVPAGWHLATPPLTSVSAPVDRLLLTSYPTRRGGNCSPERAERDLPRGGALIYLSEYRPQRGDVWAGLHKGDFPEKPAHFTLRRSKPRNYECWRVPSSSISFRAAGRPFQVHVALGAQATTMRRAQVLAALDSLRVSLLAPPPADPYAGWHSLVDEAGDTLRTPPGWVAGVTRFPRDYPHPRALFAVANRALLGLTPRLRGRLPAASVTALGPSGVLLFITEASPGPATTSFPALPHRPWPSAADFVLADRGPGGRGRGLQWQRAAAEHHRTRFSVWIVSGPAAPLEDIGRARQIAAGYAFSAGDFRNHSARRPVTAARLAQALRTNPNMPAAATCHRATRADRRAVRSFATTPRLFVCQITLPHRAAATFDVQVLAGGCFVAERRRRGQADYGCVRRGQ